MMRSYALLICSLKFLKTVIRLIILLIKNGITTITDYQLSSYTLYEDRNNITISNPTTNADGTITWELVCERNNADLSNVLGNLVKRTIGMSNQYFGGKIKNFNVNDSSDEEFKSNIC